MQPRATDDERAGGGASLGAVAGPLAGARAPQRVSTPPSSGLAAAPPARLFFSRAGERLSRLFFSHAGEGGSVPFPFSFPTPFFSIWIFLSSYPNRTEGGD